MSRFDDDDDVDIFREMKYMFIVNTFLIYFFNKNMFLILLFFNVFLFFFLQCIFM